MKITFEKKEAIVELTQKQYEKRTNGLIQFLSCFCDDIHWIIIAYENLAEEELK